MNQRLSDGEHENLPLLIEQGGRQESQALPKSPHFRQPSVCYTPQKFWEKKKKRISDRFIAILGRVFLHQLHVHFRSLSYPRV